MTAFTSLSGRLASAQTPPRDVQPIEEPSDELTGLEGLVLVALVYARLASEGTALITSAMRALG
jgi:hypothetical protein